jgi:phycocyanin alpha chain
MTYALVAGGTGPHDAYLMSGLGENNRLRLLSPSWYIEALASIKANRGITGDPVLIVNSYSDYIVNALI